MEDPIPATCLNDFIFCPASIYYHRFYDAFETAAFQSTDQINGTAAHQTVDSNNYSTSKNIITSLDAYSDQYNLICKVDMYYKDKQRIVERKKKIKRIYDGYVFQLYAQYFCLTEMGYPVTSLQLYSMDDNKKYDVKLPEDDLPMYEKFTGTIQAILHFNLEEFVQTNVEKCRHCIYEPACDRADIKEKE